MDELRYRMHYQLGGLGPVKIVTYRGYGSPERLYLRGRVLEDKHIPEAEKNDKLWENLLNTYKRLESDEVPFASVDSLQEEIHSFVQSVRNGTKPEVTGEDGCRALAAALRVVGSLRANWRRVHHHDGDQLTMPGIAR